MANPIQESPLNTFQKTNKSKGFFFLFLGVIAFSSFACGPSYTYPANNVPKSIEELCLKEYQFKVQARVVGKTVGAVTYVESIISDKGQVPKEIHEQIGKVMQVVTRVALSTDLPLDFCTVIMRDRKHGDELVISRAIDDVKRANAEIIGIEESINRTIFGHSRTGLKNTDPGAFVLKEINLQDFLTNQMVQRIRFSFTNPKEAEDDAEMGQPFVLVDGVFENKPDRRAFHFSLIALKADEPRQTVLNIFKVINQVLAGYKYTAYDVIEIQDYLNRQKLTINRQTQLDYQAKKIKDEDLLDRFLVQSQSIQEAFKLFGFNLPKESNSPGPRTDATR